MPTGLRRYYGQQHLHFITCSCFRRQPLLTPRRRDLFLFILEQTRRKYRLTVFGHVVMPEHVHLLLSEPRQGNLSTAMQVPKQSVTQQVFKKHSRPTPQTRLWPEQTRQPATFWQPRFYDFNVWSYQKYAE